MSVSNNMSALFRQRPGLPSDGKGEVLRSITANRAYPAKLLLAALAAGFFAGLAVRVGGLFLRGALFRQQTAAATPAILVRVLMVLKGGTRLFFCLAHEEFSLKNQVACIRWYNVHT